MTKHWSEILECSCGKRFRSISAEAYHRHNFPVLCRPAKIDLILSTKKMTKAEEAAILREIMR